MSPQSKHYLSIAINLNHLNLAVDAVIKLEIAGVEADTIARLHHLLHYRIV
jgi:hypothetical protein